MGKLVRIIAHTRMKIYIDGAYYAKEDAKISVFDHGLLYGDGVFEGIRIYHSRVFKLKEHIERLYYSAKAILLTIPMTPEAMAEAVLDACRQNQLENGYIRLIVTRGAGSLGLSPNSCENPSVIIIANEIQLYPPELYEKGMEIITAATSRNFVNAINPAIKSLNYLNNILAKIEASHAGCEEAIMLNSDGFVAECTGDNLFIFHHGILFTPAPGGWSTAWNHPQYRHGISPGIGLYGPGAQPHALRPVYRSGMFPDRQRSRNCARCQNRPTSHW